MLKVCSSIGLYNAFELLVLILSTFKRRKGLYFWSLLLAAFGIFPYTVGWFIDYFAHVNYVGMAFSNVGWVLLITGQSVVLYSRLHLVLTSMRIRRAVLWTVITNGVVWHTTLTMLLVTTGAGRIQSGRHSLPLIDTMEKIQMTFFSLQEFIISGIYLWKVTDILKFSFGPRRRLIWYFSGINLLLIAMDIVLLTIIYKNRYLLEKGLKVLVYSIKLKLEFSILGKLVNFVQHRGNESISLEDTRPRPEADKPMRKL